VKGGDGGSKDKSRGEEFDDRALQAAADRVRSTVAPGQISVDEAKRYFAQVANLFAGVDRLELELALFSWGALHGTGSKTDYSKAEPIVAGGVTVKATQVFGGVFPIDDRGLARRAFSTMFELKAERYLAALPELGRMLAARAARAGRPGASPLVLLDFVKGVTASTLGDSGTRQAMKDELLRRRVNSSGPSVSTPVVDLGGGTSDHHHGGAGLY